MVDKVRPPRESAAASVLNCIWILEMGSGMMGVSNFTFPVKAASHA